MTQYNTALPQDSAQMRTSAVPKGQEANYEWTTPTYITGGVGYDPADNMFQVKSNQKKWKVDFAGSTLDPAFWDITTGSGMTNTVSGGVLTIATGTTINSETILLSKETFTIPVRVMIGMNMSQKIANQEVWLELVSVDPATGLVDSAANINTAAWKIAGSDSTTNDYAQYFVQAKGITLLGSGNVDTNVVHQGGWGVFEIEPFTDECWFHARIMDNANGRAYSNVRHQNIPNPNKLYKVRIRVKNMGTAPASTTNVQFQFVNANDYAELTAEITAGRGQTSAGQSIAATLTGGTTSTTQNSGNDSYPWAVSPYPGLTQGRLDYARSNGNMEYAAVNRRGATTLQKAADLPVWQYVRYMPIAATAGVTMCTDRRGSHRFIYIVYNTGSYWRYDTWTDSYQQLASPGALGGSGTWGAGSCMVFDPSGGAEGRIWLITGYTTTAGFGFYDIATDVWTAKTVPSGAWATDGQLVHTDSSVSAGANDDFIYLLGNNATTVKRYSISGNAWTNMTAAPATIGAGAMAFWAYSQDPDKIMVFRGGGTNTLYQYSISGNSWTTPTTVPSIEAYNTGTCGAYMPDKNLFVFQKDNSHRIYAMDLATRKITPFGNAPWTGGTAHVGDGLFDIVTPDGLRFLYFRRHSDTALMRMMVHWI